MNNEFEKYTGKIWKINESIVITIPRAIVKFANYKAGDTLKIMTRKLEEEKE